MRAPSRKPLENSFPYTGIRLIYLRRYHNYFEIAQGEQTMQPATPRPESCSPKFEHRTMLVTPSSTGSIIRFSARVPSLGCTSHDFHTRPICLQNMHRTISEHGRFSTRHSILKDGSYMQLFHFPLSEMFAHNTWRVVGKHLCFEVGGSMFKGHAGLLPKSRDVSPIVVTLTKQCSSGRQ